MATYTHKYMMVYQKLPTLPAQPPETDRQTDRQTETDRLRHTHTHTHARTCFTHTHTHTPHQHTVVPTSGPPPTGDKRQTDTQSSKRFPHIASTCATMYQYLTDVHRYTHISYLYMHIYIYMYNIFSFTYYFYIFTVCVCVWFL